MWKTAQAPTQTQPKPEGAQPRGQPHHHITIRGAEARQRCEAIGTWYRYLILPRIIGIGIGTGTGTDTGTGIGIGIGGSHCHIPPNVRPSTLPCLPWRTPRISHRERAEVGAPPLVLPPKKPRPGSQLACFSFCILPSESKRRGKSSAQTLSAAWRLRYPPCLISTRTPAPPGLQFPVRIAG